MLLLTLLAATTLSAPHVCEQPAAKGWRYEDGAYHRPGTFNNVHRYRIDFATLAHLERLLEAIALRGVQVAVVLVPERMSAHPALATRTGEGWERMDWDRSLAEYHGVRSWFLDHGALAPDLASLAVEMSDQDPGFFFRSDHHWTLEGSRRSAQALSAAVRTAGGAPYLDQQEFSSTLSAVKEDFRGGMYTESAKGCEAAPFQEVKRAYETRPVDPPAVGLFDEVLPPAVVLVSDSYGSPIFNFTGFLSEALGTEVLNLSTDGGRTLSSLQRYLLSDEFRTAPAQLLVWEIQVQHLYLRDDREVPSFQSVDVYRQLIPGMAGACSGDALLHQNKVRLSGGTQRILRGSDPTWVGTGTYLHLEGPVLADIAFDLQLDHDSGLVDTVKLKPNPPHPPTQDRYLELREDFTSPLREARIETPVGSTGTITVQLCRSPY